MSGQQNWTTQGAAGLFGQSTTVGGGGIITSARDALDYARLGSPGKIPQAEYPDGFLGNVNSRRGDKLLDKIGDLNRRQYSKGVHRGERIDPGDYLWTPDWNPTRGIQTQMTGMRQSLAAEGPEPRLSHGTGGMMPPPSGPVGSDTHRNSQMSRLLPAWA